MQQYSIAALADPDIKEEATRWIEKVRDALKYIDLGSKQLDTTQEKLDYTKLLIDNVKPPFDPSPSQAKHAGWTDTVQDLRSRVNKITGDLKRAWDWLKQTLGLEGMGSRSGLGIPPWILLVGLLAGATLGAAKLWKEVVNETRRINQENKVLQGVLEGQVDASVLETIKKERPAAPILAGVGGIVLLIGLLFALPALSRMGGKS